MPVQPSSMQTAMVRAVAFMAKDIHMEAAQFFRVTRGVPTTIMVGMTTHWKPE